VLRHLRRAELRDATALARRAFDSAEIEAEVHEMLELYFESGLESIPLNQQVREALPREYFAFVADGDPAQLVGITGLYRLGTWTWPGNLWLGWTAIDSDTQGQGAGTQMLELVMKIARERGAEFLKVETDADGPATSFYLKNGFVEEARLTRHYSSQMDAAIFSIDLSGLDAASPAT
jgi:ribosomal protein S18 acetylase RimI-like enzyme